MSDRVDPDLVAAREIIIDLYSRKYAEIRNITATEDVLTCQFFDLSKFLAHADVRSFCILLTSFLEDALKIAFIQYWNLGKGKTEQYFGPSGPIGTLSQRTMVARSIGWVTQEEANEIDHLRRIRNAFAHDHRIHSFDDPLISNIASKVRPQEEIFASMPKYAEALSVANPEAKTKIRMFNAVAINISRIHDRAKLIQNELPPDWRGEGYEGLTAFSQRFTDMMIDYAFHSLTLRIERHGWLSDIQSIEKGKQTPLII